MDPKHPGLPRPQISSNVRVQDGPIAIIGMSCRFPGDATDPEAFWEMLIQAKDAWSKVPQERFNVDGFYHPLSAISGAMICRHGHFLKEDISNFDANFFNISPKEAQSMDPHQRIQLELAYEAMENAGIPLEQIRGSPTSVFVACDTQDYAIMLARDTENRPLHAGTGIAHAVISNRISFFFNLHGPSMTVSTACSGSLVALNLACQSIRSGESPQALVGGVHLTLDPDSMSTESNLGLLSEHGHCYVFDSRASGFGKGEGGAFLILKPLLAALEDGDPIRAIVRNTAISHEGRTPTMTHPSQDAQENLLSTAYAQVGLDPSETVCFEAHGTGTAIGDPIEAAAINKVFAKRRKNDSPLIVGSVKSNIGHLESASGLASVIKSVLILERGLIPPNVNLGVLSEKLAFGETVKVPQKVLEFPSQEAQRVSISNFGFGGTIGHVIIEHPSQFLPQKANGVNGSVVQLSSSTNESQMLLFVLSVASSSTGKRYAEKLLGYLTKHQDQQDRKWLVDLAHTLALRRSLLSCRAFIVAGSAEQLVGRLQRDIEFTYATENPILAFVFTGQGGQWHAMGRQLLTQYPQFLDIIRRADEFFRELGATWSLMEELQKDQETTLLNTSKIGQPSCTALQIALVDLLASWNIKPNVVIGHSSGEIAASYACGALTMESALTVSYHRGLVASSILEKATESKGAMLAARISAEQAEHIIDGYTSALGNVVVACINSPKSVTFAGDESSIEGLTAILESRMIAARRVKCDVAYHSPQVRRVADEYRHALRNIKSNKKDPRIRYYSSVTGEAKELDFQGDYWTENLSSPVQFLTAFKSMYEDTFTRGPEESGVLPGALRGFCIEIGPHSVLKGPVTEIISSLNVDNKEIQYVPSLLRNQDAVEVMLEMCGKLLSLGCPVALDAINSGEHESRPKVLTDLPPYQWDHSFNHWHQSRISKDYRGRSQPRHPLLGSMNISSSSLEPQWRGYIRLSEHPWLRGHKINSRIVYPGTAYIMMAIEAMRQKATRRLPNKRILRYKLIDISFQKALIISEEEDAIEMLFTLRPYNESARKSSSRWDEFRILSYTEGSDWAEHCRGLISVECEMTNDDRPFNKTQIAQISSLRAHSQSEKYAAAAATTEGQSVEPLAFYRTLEKAGFHYSGLHASITALAICENEALGTVSIPSTADVHIDSALDGRTLHPALLDSCLQVVFAPSFNTDIVPGLLTSIDEVEVAYKIPATIKRLRVHSSFQIGKSNERKRGLLISETDGTKISTPLITFTGITSAARARSSPTSQDSRDDESPLCYQQCWVPATDVWTPEDIIRSCAASVKFDSREVVINAACTKFIQEAVEKVSTMDLSEMPSHHKHYFAWMKDVLAQNKYGVLLGTADYEKELLKLGAVGKMIHRIGCHLPEILTGKVDPLELMLEDHLLHDYYKAGTSPVWYSPMATYARLLSDQFPDIRILEIGAGTGGATLPIVEALSSDGLGQKLVTYEFTDISAAFFAPIKEKLKGCGIKIQFRTLDIERSPTDQGFNEGSYDLIIAANVLHATRKIDETLQNVRSLLRSGGHLLLYEIIRPTLSSQLVSGSLPGWWLGVDDGRLKAPVLNLEQWNYAFKRNGFSGVDVSMPDYIDQESLKTAVLISTASTPNIGSNRPVASAIIPADMSPLQALSMDKILEALEYMEENVKSVTIDKTDDIQGQDLIVLVEILEALSLTYDESLFSNIRRMIISANNVLWVTRGALHESSSPNSSFILGLLRTLRNELPGKKLTVLDLDYSQPIEPYSIAKAISQVRKSMCIKRPDSRQEWEYAFRDGKLYVPRLAIEDSVTNYVASCHGSGKPISQNFLCENRPLRVGYGTPGLLSELRFEDDPEAVDSIGEDELLINPRAYGLLFRHTLLALGLLNRLDSFGDVAGIVTGVGPALQDQFRIGDRVCAIARRPYTTISRVEGCLARKIPENLDFPTAASLPLSWLTAYLTLVKMASLQKGESILIHSAAGAVGQCAIRLSQLIGAEVFATVGSEEKKSFLMNHFGLAEERIFSSRQDSFLFGINRLTCGKGVDVVLNHLTGDLFTASVKCVANFGRFIEMGQRDIDNHFRMDISPFMNHITFSSLNMVTLVNEKKAYAVKSFHEAMNLALDGNFSFAPTFTTSPLTDLQATMRLLASGESVGKLIVECDENTMVAATIDTSGPKFKADVTYLITGGLGGLGKEVCKWMIPRGARNIALLGRSTREDQDSHAFLDAMNASGARVIYYQADAGDAVSLRAALEACTRDMPPVKGVVHGAMVLRDAMFENLSYEEYSHVVGPKVTGTRNLHEMLCHNALDFFVMLSSTCGVVGRLGQSIYAGSSTFQDAFATSCAWKGQPAISIDLGVVRGAGYVAQNPGLQPGLEQSEIRSMSLQHFLTILAYATMEARPTNGLSQIVAGLQRSSNHEANHNLRETRFLYLKTAEGLVMDPIGATEGQTALSKILSSLSTEDEIRAAISKEVVVKLARCLGKQPAEMKLEKSPSYHGADSLVAVEVNNWIYSETGATFSATQILTYQSLITLSGDIARWVIRNRQEIERKDRELEDESDRESRIMKLVEKL